MKDICISEDMLLNEIDTGKRIIGFCTTGEKISPTSTFKSYLLLAEKIKDTDYIPLFIFLNVNIAEYPDIQNLLDDSDLREYHILQKNADSPVLNLKQLTSLGLIFCTEHLNREKHNLPANTRLAASVHVRTDTWDYRNGLIYFFFNNFNQYNNRVRPYPIGRFDYHFVDNRVAIAELDFLQKLYKALHDPANPPQTREMKICLGYLRSEAYNSNSAEPQDKIILFAPGGSAQELHTKEIREEDFAAELCRNFPDYKIWMRTAPWNKSADYLKLLNEKLSQYPNFICNEETHTDNINNVYARATILVTDWSINCKSFTLSQQRPNIRCASTANPLTGTLLTRNLPEAITAIKQVLTDVEGYGRKLYQELLREMRPVGGTIDYIADNIDKLFDGTLTEDTLSYTPQDPHTQIDYQNYEMLDRFINFAISNGQREFGVDPKFYNICRRIHAEYPPSHQYNKWLLKTLRSPLLNWMEQDPQRTLYYKIMLTRGYLFAGEQNKAAEVFSAAFRLHPEISLNPEFLQEGWSNDELKIFIRFMLNQSDKWDITKYQQICQGMLSIFSRSDDKIQLTQLLEILAR